MARRGLSADHKPRWRAFAAVTLLHLFVLAALIRAFTPELATHVVRSITQAVTITASTSKPPLLPATPPMAAPAMREPAAAAGRKAVPRPIIVAPTPILTPTTPAPPITGAGQADAAGGFVFGSGTGAQGNGDGRGAGGEGEGGRATATVKIAGDINSASDYPRATRSLRVGAFVTIDLTVNELGHVANCRIVQPSPDPEADRITCDLATARFRFQPARDRLGKPQSAIYRWRQRWFY